MLARWTAINHVRGRSHEYERGAQGVRAQQWRKEDLCNIINWVIPEFLFRDFAWAR